MKAKTNTIEFMFENNKEFINSLLSGFEDKKILLKYFANKSKYLKKNSEKIDYVKLNKDLKKEIGHTLYEISINGDNIEYFTFGNNNVDSKEIDFDNLNEFKYSEIIKMILKRILYEKFIKNNHQNEFLQKDNNLVFLIDKKNNIKEMKFELLRLDLNLDIKRKKFNIILNKERKAYNIKDLENVKFSLTNDEENTLILLNNENMPKLKIIKLDARKSNIKFMDFNKDVKKTILYKMNEILDCYEEYFNNNFILYKNDFFEYNNIKSIVLNDELSINNDILIINLKKQNLKPIEMKILTFAFREKNYDISFFNNGRRSITIEHYNQLKSLNNTNLIFLNDEEIDYEEHKEKINENLDFDKEDFYTYFKYNNLIFKKNNIVFQNIIGDILEEGNIIKCNSKISEDLLKYQIDLNEFKFNQKLNIGNEDIVYNLSPKFKKVLKEISIKEFLISNEKLNLQNNINGNFKLLYYYRKTTENNVSKEFKLFIDIKLIDGILEIENYGEISLREWSKFKPMFNYYTKNNEQIVIDGSFIILNKNTEDYLMYYTKTNYIPQIVGNLNVDFVKTINEQLINNENKIKRITKGNNVILPYYLIQSSKKVEENREKIYIENKDTYFQYFIPSLENVSGNMSKASRIYFGFIKDKNNNIIEDYQNNTLYELFFSTFSSGIITDDNTKTNLLEKLIRTLIFN